MEKRALAVGPVREVGEFSGIMIHEEPVGWG